jgi:hypothetical protein
MPNKLKEKVDALITFLEGKGVTGKNLRFLVIEAKKNSMNKETSIISELKKLANQDGLPESIEFQLDMALKEITNKEIEELEL